MSNNNSTAVNAEVSNEVTTMKTYNIDIASTKGHDTRAGLTLEAATECILENAENNARWVFINGEKFEFKGTDYRTESNIQKLQAQLQAMDDPAVLLTGILVGGVK